MRTFFAYVRVSTTRQGEHGVSLEQQREAIKRYAEKHELVIIKVFEELETAAKRGRPLFGQMLKLLRQGKATGVIIHKIDRSARNLKDWADLGELIDAGVEVHFANESLDLHSRSGRLSADIQAVVAADYIRNLREETIKGFYGRLKQGVDPRPAPLGYLDQGAGKPKIPDPHTAPLIRMMFEKYATGRYNFTSLVSEMQALGLCNKYGTPITITKAGSILRNPFYMGIIQIRKTGETFPGGHQPLIGSVLFERVQEQLKGRYSAPMLVHNLLFRKLFRCAQCGNAMVGEIQKQYVYYRCHTKTCSTRYLRQELLERAVLDTLRQITFGEAGLGYIKTRITELHRASLTKHRNVAAAIKLRLGNLADRQDRLLNSYLDDVFDKEVYVQRRDALAEEQRLLAISLDDLSKQPAPPNDPVPEILDFVESPDQVYASGSDDEKRELIRVMTTARTVDVKEPTLQSSLPFSLAA